eukprot:TRINITY_DN1699_c0_g1_i1.p1 TRINITY_DN1699_c0_g1~~TRINITY_DN1699_c0_g1_i1.p1  ORF type:complete len:206 (+),score=30.23 TRINITY_DN1699_c0_g1_i1:70-687(+)
MEPSYNVRVIDLCWFGGTKVALGDVIVVKRKLWMGFNHWAVMIVVGVDGRLVYYVGFEVEGTGKSVTGKPLVIRDIKHTERYEGQQEKFVNAGRCFCSSNEFLTTLRVIKLVVDEWTTKTYDFKRYGSNCQGFVNNILQVLDLPCLSHTDEWLTPAVTALATAGGLALLTYDKITGALNSIKQTSSPPCAINTNEMTSLVPTGVI